MGSSYRQLLSPIYTSLSVPRRDIRAADELRVLLPQGKNVSWGRFGHDAILNLKIGAQSECMLILYIQVVHFL